MKPLGRMVGDQEAQVASGFIRGNHIDLSHTDLAFEAPVRDPQERRVQTRDLDAKRSHLQMREEIAGNPAGSTRYDSTLRVAPGQERLETASDRLPVLVRGQAPELISQTVRVGTPV